MQWIKSAFYFSLSIGSKLDKIHKMAESDSGSQAAGQVGTGAGPAGDATSVRGQQFLVGPR